MAWYGTTLIDQVLFTYFPEASTFWVDKTGGYPIPVEGAGMGCVGVAPPRRLLAGVNTSQWHEFVEFYLGEVDSHLEKLSGVRPRRFFEAMLRDVRNSRTIDPLEEYLIQQALARFIE